jgi:ubiquinone/menaquinone biosynthesis C-methylase UbiE
VPDYDVTAEFYDVMHADRYLRVTRALLDRWLGTPRAAVIDVGAGTGLGTALLAQRCNTPVHAVEPSRSMRAVLLSRLAGQEELLSRVQVHPCRVQDLNLHDVADFVLCLNTMGTLGAPDRADSLTSLARAMVRGGRLVIQRPPTEAVEFHTTLPSWSLGPETYGGDVDSTALGDDVIEWRFTYRVTNGDAVVRQEHESFRGYVVSPEDFEEELRRAGFAVVGADQHDVVIATRIVGIA